MNLLVLFGNQQLAQEVLKKCSQVFVNCNFGYTLVICLMNKDSNNGNRVK